jgi:hypothetical protein
MNTLLDLGAIARIEVQLADLARRLPEIVRAQVGAILEQRDADRVGGLRELAEWIGAPTAEAARKRVERDPALAAIAIRTAGGHRRWRKSEVLGLLAQRAEK